MRDEVAPASWPAFATKARSDRLLAVPRLGDAVALAHGQGGAVGAFGVGEVALLLMELPLRVEQAGGGGPITGLLGRG